MMKITKRINRMLDEYQAVFLVQLPLTRSIVVYAQNPRDVDYLCMFWDVVKDNDVFSVLKCWYDYYNALGIEEKATKYKNAISQLQEQEGII